MSPAQKFRNWLRLRQNRRRSPRRLEIGPGETPIPGFESLNIRRTGVEDYVADASQPLPFRDGEFELVYASHVLEHIPWYRTLDTLREWARVIRPGGHIEIWVPDALRICKAFVEAENGGPNPLEADPWQKFNPEKDPCVWAAGRIFTYGDGSGAVDHPNWHRAIFTERYLMRLLVQAGFRDPRRLERHEVRGYDHGWINMGVGATR
jgi:SAM-dependent methyltransferase